VQRGTYGTVTVTCIAVYMQLAVLVNNGLGLVPLKGNEVVVAVTLVVTTKFCKFYL
jgi:hypothetical protein